MNLTNPLALLWAGLAIPVVVFYILKIRLRRVPVSTVMFWQQIFEEKQARSIWQKLRHLLSLLLQLAVLILLVLALSEPFFTGQAQEARRLVLVIDNSAGMRATDVAPSRLAQAKTEGLKLIDALRQHDQLAIIAAGTQPHVVCGLTGHQRTLREALNSVGETDGPNKVPEAVALARRLLADHPDGRAIVISDGAFPDAEALFEADDVAWTPIGTQAGNVGITRFQVRRSLLDPIGYQILAEVENFSDEPVELRLELQLGFQIVDVIPLKLEAGGKWSQVLEKVSAEGGELVATLDRDDALRSDNIARAILPRRERQPVILVSEGNVFLQRVFEANPLVDLTMTSEPPAEVPPHTVVVYHRQVPNPIPPGKVLVIQPENSTDAWELADTLDNPIVAGQDKDSPLLAHVRLDNVLMPEARRLVPAGDPQRLVQTITDDPIYLAYDDPNRKMLVLTVNLNRGDLPLRTAFPILMSNALSWFAGTRGELRESLATGAVSVVQLPEALQSADELVLQAPGGESRPLPVHAGGVTVGPLDRCGIWRITRPSEDVTQPGPSVELACNLANRQASDLRGPDPPVEKSSIAQAGFGSRPLWIYLLAAAWLLIGTEWFLYQRRWIS
jgi:hypothetical protein